MKVLIINPLANPNVKNSGIFVSRQTTSLIKAGVEAIEYIPIRCKNILKLVREHRKIIQHENPTIVHMQYGSILALVTAISIKSLKKKPKLVISFCGSDLYGSKSTSKTKSVLSILASQLAAFLSDGIIAKSKHLKGKIWIKSKQTIVIPNGVNLKLFKPITKEKARLLLDINQHNPIILFNEGNNHKDKRLDIAEETFKLVKERIPTTSLMVINEYPSEKMPLLLNACDVLLVCSDHEGSPNIVKEAMACNLPIVSVNCGDVQERIENDLHSFIVEKNPKTLSEFIEKVIENGGRSKGSTLIKELSEENVALKILKFYESIDQS